jgi:pyruvate ferredoxin oxidoreductase delta subunit
MKKQWPEKWKEYNLGGMVFDVGNSRTFKTGSWRSQRPVWDNSKCIKCGLCYLYCPEGCVQEDEKGYFTADMDYCKGCGICAHECWPMAITMIEEG